MRSRLTFSFLFLSAVLAACYEQSGDPEMGSVTIGSDDVLVRVRLDPFQMEFVSREEGAVLETAEGGISVTRRDFAPGTFLIEGFDHVERSDAEWMRFSSASLLGLDPDQAAFLLAEPEDPNLSVLVAVRVSGREAEVAIEIVDQRDGGRTSPANVVRQEFAVREGERFVGMGERESGIVHDGRTIACWTEEGGIGGGESAQPGPQNPYPHGEGMTHFPVPFYISSAGYGLWLDTSYRSEFSFGADGGGTVGVSAEEPRLRYTVFVNDDPKRTIEDFTYRTGRARLPAPWVFGPRKRVGPNSEAQGMSEIAALREYGIPMTTVDDSIHFLPHGSHLGREEELAEWTRKAHGLGYKVMGYFNPYVSAEEGSAAAYRDEGRRLDIFVRLADGSEFRTLMISGHPQEVLTLDLSDPDAVAWYEGVMREALDLGYDGWMLDFGEYLPRDAVLSNGLTGEEAHNLYPLLSQEAARNFLDRERGNDYLFYVRSGYTGTQSLAPMVWSGDPSASFDDARGLPAQVRAGVSAGLSGIPYWGSDGTGFTCLADPPPDKETYLRWMAFAALSPDMHEQNACAAKASGLEKWKLWNDDETRLTYAAFARLHTMLFPYIYGAAKEAAETGLPIMRHALLYHHELPEAWEPEHEYYFGPSLYVAPVVRRGETSRTLWLPPGTWFDWWTLEPVEGGGTVSRGASLDIIPIWLKEGGMVPMLAPDVQTLAPTDDPSVVDMDDRGGVLYVRAAVTADAPAASTRLVDGRTLTVELTGGLAGLTDGSKPASEDELGSCVQCGRLDDLAGGARRIRVTVGGGSAELPGLRLAVAGADARIIVHWDIIILQ